MSSRLKGLLVPRVRLYCCMWEPFHSYHACETLSILHPKAQWLGIKHMRLCPLVMSQHVSRTNSVCVSPSQSAHFSSGNLVPTGPLLFVSFLLFGVRSQVPSQFLPKRSWGGGEWGAQAPTKEPMRWNFIVSSIPQGHAVCLGLIYFSVLWEQRGSHFLWFAKLIHLTKIVGKCLVLSWLLWRSKVLNKPDLKRTLEYLSQRIWDPEPRRKWGLSWGPLRKVSWAFSPGPRVRCARALENGRWADVPSLT